MHLNWAPHFYQGRKGAHALNEILCVQAQYGTRGSTTHSYTPSEGPVAHVCKSTVKQSSVWQAHETPGISTRQHLSQNLPEKKAFWLTDSNPRGKFPTQGKKTTFSNYRVKCSLWSSFLYFEWFYTDTYIINRRAYWFRSVKSFGSDNCKGSSFKKRAKH